MDWPLASVKDSSREVESFSDGKRQRPFSLSILSMASCAFINILQFKTEGLNCLGSQIYSLGLVLQMEGFV